MPDIREQEHPARKMLPIIYVLDTSGSMTGARIAAVNTAMNEAMDVLKDVADKNPTAELKIGVLRFASGAEWITSNGFVYMRDYYWNDLDAGGLTDYGSALDQLNEKLSRKQFMDSDYGYKVPVIIFMSDGEPTDDYESALKRIESTNNWYKMATKIAIAVGDDANKEILAKVAGNSEAVIEVNDVDVLKKLIKVVSVTSAMIGSKSRTDNDLTEEIIDEIGIEMGEGVTIGTTSGSGGDSGNDIPGGGWDTPVIDDEDPWGKVQWD